MHSDESPTPRVPRLMRRVAQIIDKGAGAERRNEAYARSQGIIPAYSQDAGRWLEGRVRLLPGQVSFIGRNGSSLSFLFTHISEQPGSKLRIYRDRGLRMLRVQSVDLSNSAGDVMTIAVRRKDLPVIRSALASSPGTSSQTDDSGA